MSGAEFVEIPDSHAVPRRIATDEIDGIQYQWIKIGFGEDGAFVPVASGTPMPVTFADDTIVEVDSLPLPDDAATETTQEQIRVLLGTLSLGGVAPMLGDGRKIVTAAGTRVTLAASTACSWVSITAETDNSGLIIVGAATVVANLAARRGAPLYAGDGVTIPVGNLANVYIDSTVSGDGVTFIYG